MTMETVSFLLAPLVMALLLVGIHCYLGLHVLARGVIFVDLALAQVAALGTILTYTFGIEHSDVESYIVSLTLTLVAALFLSLSNQYKQKISQEAVIGVLYAFASGAAILLLDKISHGSEHLKSAMVGQLLWVTWPDVGKVFLIYSAVAVIHYIFRRPLIKNSFGQAYSWKWDFLFYALFGVVITSSVHVAGVLLVFVFLIVPSIISSYFYSDLKMRLLFGWGLGAVLSTLGMALSYVFDVPAGALIVVVFTLLPLLGITGLSIRGIISRIS